MGSLIEGATKVLGVAGSITTLIALAALSLLAAYLFGAQWLRGKDDAAKAAIDRGDNDALARLLGGINIPLEGLSADQKYALATEDLKTRARQRTIVQGLIFFGLLAILGFALALAFRSEDNATPDKVVKLDPLAALNILRLVPESERQNVCLTLMSKDDCDRAAPMIASLTYQAPSPSQSRTIADVASRGAITQSEANELAACGGAFDFKVVNNLLTCADGTPLPVVAMSSAAKPMTGQEVIVLHATVTSAKLPFSGIANLLANGRPDLAGPLAHLLISRNGAIAQTAPFNQRANHVGAGAPWHGVAVKNSNSIGIEMINTGNYAEDPYPETQIKATTAAISALMRAYGIRIVVGHNEVAPQRKTDPGPGVAAAFRQALGLPRD